MITLGMDEVGRGCWAGPLVAGAVILPAEKVLKNCPLALRDSKKLSKKQREIAAEWIHEYAVAIGLGWVEPSEVDNLGLSQAVRLAFIRALAEVNAQHDQYDDIIIDGNINYCAENPKAQAVVRADDSVPSVSAASIVAKVARDAYMADIGQRYAGYGFEKHVGYGTATHLSALKALGVTDIHRRSYKPVRELLV